MKRESLPGWIQTGLALYVIFAGKYRMPVSLIKAGVTLVTLAIGGFALKVSFRTATESIWIELSAETIGWFIYAAFFLGVLLVVSGSYVLHHTFSEEKKRTARQKTVVIYHTGLQRHQSGRDATLLGAEAQGRIEHIECDQTPFFRNNRVTDPILALTRVHDLDRQIEQRVGHVDRNDVSIVYAGQAPVPFAVLAGYLVSNKYPVSVRDYDRFNDSWHTLSGTDDGERLERVTVGQFPAEDVAISLSVSYAVNHHDIKSVVGDIPLVALSLPNVKIDSVNSLEKLNACKKDVLDAFGYVLKANPGVKRLHLFCAAQNSFCFSIGAVIDRNHPVVLAYQYQRGDTPPYMWAVKFNDPSEKSPTIVMPPLLSAPIEIA